MITAVKRLSTWQTSLSFSQQSIHVIDIKCLHEQKRPNQTFARCVWLGRVLSIHRISTVYLTSNVYAYLYLFWLRWNGLSQKHSQWLAHIDISYVRSVLNAHAWHVIYFEHVFWWLAHVYLARLKKNSFTDKWFDADLIHLCYAANY